jgi:hypothetical protein
MKLFSSTLYEDARIWYEGLPDKDIKTMDKFEEKFLKKWSLHKRFPALDISGYPNPFPLGLVDNCPKFDGNPSLASPHVTKFLDYFLETKVRHQDLLIRLFLLSLGTEQREWLKNILIPKSITSLKIFIRKFLERWDPTMRLCKDALDLQREGLCSIPVKEDQESINQQQVEERVTNPKRRSNNSLMILPKITKT